MIIPKMLQLDVEFRKKLKVYFIIGQRLEFQIDFEGSSCLIARTLKYLDVAIV